MRIMKREDWKTEPLPHQYVTLRFILQFSVGDMEQIRKGLLPRQMEDKWFIY